MNKQPFLTYIKFSLVSLLISSQAYSTDRVIYGDDNRIDIYQVEDNNILILAESTAMLVNKKDLKTSSDNSDIFKLPTDTIGEQMDLCESEPFYNQPSPGFCSGFLVAEDVFVTAGHCIRTETDCQDTSFVFDYGVSEEGSTPNPILKSNVYNCKEIIARELNPNDKNDFAVIRLDRKVLDREPLEFRTEGKIEDGEELTLIGHPSGLPTKVADSASVRDNTNDKFITATTDSYGGNSGSAVFNSMTGVVEGILVRGENDYVRKGTCYVSNHCEEDECRGEDITRAVEFAKHVKEDTGEPDTKTLEVSKENLNLAIPDNSNDGISVNLEMLEDGVLESTSIYFDISHSYVGDLTLKLIHPDGTSLVIRNRSGASEDNIDTIYGEGGVNSPALDSLKGKSVKGVWKAIISDHSLKDTGKLNQIKLTLKVKK